MYWKSRREKQFVDRPVQGALLWAALRYWFLCLFAMGGLTFIGWLLAYPGIDNFASVVQSVKSAVPVFMMASVAVALLLPLALVDLIRMSNRFVGPVLRVRRSLARMANGEEVPPIVLRKGDYWTELADTHNEIRQRILDLQRWETVSRPASEAFPAKPREGQTRPIAVPGMTLPNGDPAASQV